MTNPMRALLSRLGLGLLAAGLWIGPAGSQSPPPPAQTQVAPQPADRLPSVEELQAALMSASQAHPRLFAQASTLRALRERVQADPLADSLAQALIRQAKHLQDVAPVRHKKRGRRLLGVSRQAVARLLTLSFAFHLSGDRAHVRRAEAEMLAIAAFPDWNPEHFLDVGEMAFGLAFAYDWLYHELEPETRARVRTALLEKAVRVPWTTEHDRWVRATNNWGPVCHGGLTIAALVLDPAEGADERGETPGWAAKTIHSALRHMPRSLAAYAPRGSYPEGPGYWEYGTSFTVLLVGALESTLGHDFGLSQAPGFAETGQYPALVTGPSGQTFNYADGSAHRKASPALFWLADRYARPDWLWGESERLARAVRRLQRSESWAGTERLLPLALLWYAPAPAETALAMPLHWNAGGDVPISIHRSSWSDPHAVFVGLKGGSPSAHHGQMDTGSFVFEADGVRWALDLGAEGYHGIEARGMNLWNRGQTSDRWKVFRLNNLSHSTLVIDGEHQIAAGRGDFSKFEAGGESPYSVLDLSTVYAGQAQRVLRAVRWLPSRQVLIQDELEGLAPDSQVRWGMLTEAQVVSQEGPVLRLEQDGQHLELRVLTSEPARWEVADTATPPSPWDSPNPGTRMVTWTCGPDPNGALRLRILLTPGSVAASDRVVPEAAPLSDG